MSFYCVIRFNTCDGDCPLILQFVIELVNLDESAVLLILESLYLHIYCNGENGMSSLLNFAVFTEICSRENVLLPSK